MYYDAIIIYMKRGSSSPKVTLGQLGPIYKPLFVYIHRRDAGKEKVME
jgi:hypothetical protein